MCNHCYSTRFTLVVLWGSLLLLYPLGSQGPLCPHAASYSYFNIFACTSQVSACLLVAQCPLQKSTLQAVPFCIVSWLNMHQLHVNLSEYRTYKPASIASDLAAQLSHLYTQYVNIDTIITTTQVHMDNKKTVWMCYVSTHNAAWYCIVTKRTGVHTLIYWHWQLVECLCIVWYVILFCITYFSAGTAHPHYCMIAERLDTAADVAHLTLKLECWLLQISKKGK